MRKSKIITIILLSFTYSSLAQKEYLEPAPEYSTPQEWRKGYYDTLFPLLFKNFNSLPYARYWVSVSFGKEYSFSVEERDQKFYILSNSLTSSVWYTRRTKKIKVRTSKTEIEESLFLSVGELFKVLIDSTRTPDEPRHGSDGNIYYIQTTSALGRINTGKTWSPANSTLLARLVVICDRLYRIGMGDSYDEDEINTALKSITKQLM